jgi:all-trans-retinol 13,14-reductase
MEEDRYDVIVIGSGIGGLTVASLMAQLAGRRVLVLERHFKLGGFTHSFSRQGFTWDVGVHYVGGMAPGSMYRGLLDLITGSGVTWQRMGGTVERFEYPGLTFEVADDPQRLHRDLISCFPAEEGAIRQYFRDLKRAEGWIVRHMAGKLFPRPLAAALSVPARSLALQTTKGYLDSAFQDPRLRALLASQWGDYGLPPSRSAFAIHALIASHYLEGGYYPVGGAGTIPGSVVPIVEKAGGACLVNHEVTAVLVEDGVAKGVRATARRGHEEVEREFRAPVVVSDAGAHTTYTRLLPPALDLPEQRAVAGLPSPPSAVTLYLGLRESPASLGFRGENRWLFSSFDHDAMARNGGLLEGRPAYCYLSFPSLRDPLAGRHTAQVIAATDYARFAAWRERPWRCRGDEYAALKRTISEGLLELVERRYPGFSRLVAYQELSTPLSVEKFTGHSGGAIYGVPATPERYRGGWFGVQTPVRGLLLAGSDVGSPGVVGAMMGGVMAASRLLGAAGYPRIMGAARGSGGPTRRYDTVRTANYPES